MTDLVDPRAHHLFTQTVVDLSAAEEAGEAEEAEEEGHVDATAEITNLEIRWPTTAE